MSAVFEQVGAPLNNHTWSWGAVREHDKIVFLRVWEDEGRKMDDLPEKYFIGVWTTDSTDTSLGANERRSHIELIKAGYKVYLLMCERGATASKSSVSAFDARELRDGGRLIERDGVLWIALLARVPVRLMRPASAVQAHVLE